MTTTNIYILRLECGKYYVGKSANVMERYQEHLNGNGSAWTQKYRPVSLERTIEHVSPFEEDKTTKEYMAKYGIDRVRGGSYSMIQLTAQQIEAIQQEIRGATDRCSRCCHEGHFVKDCVVARPAPRPVSRTIVSHPVANNCYRCGRKGHYANRCYANIEYESDSDYDYDSESDWD